MTKNIRKYKNMDWQRMDLDEVIKNLPPYLQSAASVLDGTYILNQCFDDLMGQGHYMALINLYDTAIATFKSNIPIPDARDKHHTKIGTTNIERFFTEYVDLKLNLADAEIMRHSLKDAQNQLEEIADLLDSFEFPHQKLRAYLLFLKFNSFGHEVDFIPDLIDRVRQFTISLDPLSQADAMMAVGYHDYHTGDLQVMEKTLKEIKKMLASRFRNDPEQISKITAEYYLYIGTIYSGEGKFDKAEEYLNIAVQQSTRINHSAQMMLAISEIATLFSNKKDIPNAMAWIKQAYQKYESLPEQHDYQLARLEHIQGNIYYDLEDYEQALEYFLRVLPIWESYERIYHVAQINNAIGSTLIKLKRPIEAIKYLATAEEICYTLDDKIYANGLLKTIDKNFQDARGMQDI